MANVKLPSGKIIKVPDDMTKIQTYEFLHKNLPDTEEYASDREKIGDQLDTSGWGAAIGGTIGGIAGAVGGIFTSPSIALNPITLGVAGNAAGSAIGEGIEQYITGRGEGSDIAKEAAYGAGFGLIPGAGGQAFKTAAKHGFGKVGKAVLGGTASTATGAGIGAGTGVVTGAPKEGAITGAAIGLTASTPLGGRIISKIVGGAVNKTKQSASKILKTTGIKSSSKEAPIDEIIGGAEKILTGKIKTLIGRPTGVFETAAGILDIRRGLIRAVTEGFKKQFKRDPSPAEAKVLETAAEEAAKRLQKEYKADSNLREKLAREIDTDYLLKETIPSVKPTAPKPSGPGLLGPTGKPLKPLKPYNEGLLK